MASRQQRSPYDQNHPVNLTREIKRVLATSDAGGGPHAADHENGGSDEIDVTDLSGVLASGQRAAILVNATGEVLIATAAAPTAGQVLRADNPPTSASWQDAAAPGLHAETHQNGGGDEISVAGLSGLLADAQTPLAHTHEITDITDMPVIPSTSYTPGAFTIQDNQFRLMAEKLELSGTQTVTIEGNGSLRIF